MSEPDLNDIRAIETTLTAITPLPMRDQVRVLTWVIEKLDLALDMKLAIRDAHSKHRNYIEMAWEKAPHAMESIGEFLSAAAPESMVDRVLVAATFLQMNSNDPDRDIITGKEINGALRKMRVAVPNVTDAMYTLMRRNPPHVADAGRVPGRKDWKGYRVTESGIDYVHERIVHFGSDNRSARVRRA
jgi:hypothetical protein